MQDGDVPAVALYNIAEALNDAQVKYLELTEEVMHAKARILRFVGGPVRFENLPKEKSSALPLLGEHGRKILSELGYHDAAFDELPSQGITRVEA